MPTKIERALLSAWPLEKWQDVTVVVAVSGGADSMALLSALHAVKDQAGDGRLVVAHFNHRWRGGDSDGDQQFVAQFSSGLGLECVTEVAGVAASSEESAREQRWAFLKSTAQTAGARYLVTAHTADDQVETILHRILRGTGIAGLAGIPRFRALTEQVTVVRPLLDVTANDLRNYLRDRRLSWRDDASNEDPAYTRNRIRHQLLPLLTREYNSDVRGAIDRLGRLAGECQTLIDQQVSRRWDAVSLRPSAVSIALAPLQETPPYVLRELLRRVWAQQGWPQQSMTQQHWQHLAELIGATTPTAQMFPGSIHAHVEGGVLTLLPS